MAFPTEMKYLVQSTLQNQVLQINEQLMQLERLVDSEKITVYSADSYLKIIKESRETIDENSNYDVLFNTTLKRQLKEIDNTIESLNERVKKIPFDRKVN